MDKIAGPQRESMNALINLYMKGKVLKVAKNDVVIIPIRIKIDTKSRHEYVEPKIKHKEFKKKNTMRA